MISDLFFLLRKWLLGNGLKVCGGSIVLDQTWIFSATRRNEPCSLARSSVHLRRARLRQVALSEDSAGQSSCPFIVTRGACRSRGRRHISHLSPLTKLRQTWVWRQWWATVTGCLLSTSLPELSRGDVS